VAQTGAAAQQNNLMFNNRRYFTSGGCGHVTTGDATPRGAPQTGGCVDRTAVKPIITSTISVRNGEGLNLFPCGINGRTGQSETALAVFPREQI